MCGVWMLTKFQEKCYCTKVILSLFFYNSLYLPVLNLSKYENNVYLVHTIDPVPEMSSASTVLNFLPKF